MSRVLIIDDSATLRLMIEDTLRSSAVADECVTATNGAEGIKKLLNEPFDLVICDVQMPDIDGYRFLALKGEQEHIADIPVIMLTATANDVSSKVRCFEAGASDYVTKPYEREELVARVRTHLSLKQLRDELRRKAEQLELLTVTDDLTGLSNRRHFFARMETELVRGTRRSTPVGFLMLDVDHFKSINDTHGHQGGDLALAAVGRILKAEVRPYDVPARYGGEEFCVLLPDTSAEQAIEVAERLRTSIEQLELEHDGQRFGLTVSIGVSVSDRSPVNASDLIKRADQALYIAKSEGRNRTAPCATRVSARYLNSA
ncbi:MAG: diguanylate cyclase [Myxococcota bacterium]